MRLILGVLVVLLLVPAIARADGGPAEKLVTATKVWKMGKGAGNPNSCYVALLAEYKELKGYSAIKWTSKNYSADDPSFKGAPIEGPINAPYDDVYTPLGQRLEAPKNRHWTEIGFSSQAGNGDCSELLARSMRITRDPIKVLYRSNRGTMRIYGTIDPSLAFERLRLDRKPPEREVEELPQEEITKLLSGLKVVAKGPKKTFTAAVLPDGAKQSYFDMQIPGRYFGRYDVSIKSARKDVAVSPEKRLVRVKPGLEERTAWESGYDCDVPPPGLRFTPRDEYLMLGPGDVFVKGFEWNCRARRGMMSWRSEDFDAQSSCNPVTPGTDRGVLESGMMAVLPGGALTPSGGREYSMNYSGSFVNRDEVRMRVQNEKCDVDISARLRSRR